jgi:tRNA threonylcarbamoyladenosine modification (KEOPS) complex  Pcc1 subunit
MAKMAKQARKIHVAIEPEVVKRTLPPPDELRFRSRKVKVTVEVDAPTVAAFRRKAGGKTKAYLRMMGELLDVYATQELVGRGR